MDAIRHFQDHGGLRLAGAIAPGAAAAMCNVVWDGLALAGIQRDDRVTSTIERSTHLQRLGHHSPFRAVGSAALLSTIHALKRGHARGGPKNWGALFVAFPALQPWRLPARG